MLLPALPPAMSLAKRAKEKAPIRSSSSDGSSSPGSAKKTSRTKEKAPVCSSSSDGSSSSDSSSSSDGSSSSSSSSYGSNNHYYFKKDDMPKELREALRKEVIRQYDALPEKNRIDLRRTFAKQRKRVNNDIIPSIMETINRDKFPISNEITYDIIHSLHRHRREEFLKKSRSSAERKFQRKRKHNNSRRHDKRRKRAKMINHLQLTENSLIKKFKPKDLQLLIDHSVYHSPEDSETDLESEKSIIVVKDLKWRSSTLRSFLRDYIDRLRAEETNSRKLRERIVGNNFSNDTLAPLLAPRWTRAGYSGRLRDEVIKACYSKYNQQHHEETTESQYTNPNYETSFNDNAYAAPKQGLGDLDSNDTPPDKPRNQIENQRNDQNQPDSRTYNDGYDADVGEEEEEEEVLLTSNDQPVNQNTDDDNLEMDD
ncbi:unnamed protein product [Rhizophagus irregularis]|nr:unnamed protein product [Rhizophagus irregularis]